MKVVFSILGLLLQFGLSGLSIYRMGRGSGTVEEKKQKIDKKLNETWDKFDKFAEGTETEWDDMAADMLRPVLSSFAELIVRKLHKKEGATA